MHYGGEKMGQNRGNGHQTLTPNESVFTFLAEANKQNEKFHQNP